MACHEPNQCFLTNNWVRQAGGIGLNSTQVAVAPGLPEANLIGLQESDIRLGLAQGGYIRSLLVVTRPGRLKGSPEHVLWVHPSWLKGFYPFCTHRGRSMRVYKDVDLLLSHCRSSWDYRGGITFRLHDDPKIQNFRDAVAQRATRLVADLLGNEAILD